MVAPLKIFFWRVKKIFLKTYVTIDCLFKSIGAIIFKSVLHTINIIFWKNTGDANGACTRFVNFFITIDKITQVNWSLFVLITFICSCFANITSDSHWEVNQFESWQDVSHLCFLFIENVFDLIFWDLRPFTSFVLFIIFENLVKLARHNAVWFCAEIG